MGLLTMIFAKLGVPIAPHKTVGPKVTLDYLGVILDAQRMEARLPQDKLTRLVALVKTFLCWKRCTKREALSLLGHFNFAARVIPLGRSFISRLLEVTRRAKELHHHVHLTTDCKEDLRMWHIFLRQWNGVSLFLDNSCTPAPDMSLYTDALGTIGYGAYYHGQWLLGAWPANMEDHIEGACPWPIKN